MTGEQLSEEQLEAAKRAGMTPEQFAGWGTVHTVDDFEELKRRESQESRDAAGAAGDR